MFWTDPDPVFKIWLDLCTTFKIWFYPDPVWASKFPFNIENNIWSALRLHVRCYLIFYPKYVAFIELCIQSEPIKSPKKTKWSKVRTKLWYESLGVNILVTHKKIQYVQENLFTLICAIERDKTTWTYGNKMGNTIFIFVTLIRIRAQFLKTLDPSWMLDIIPTLLNFHGSKTINQ